MNLYIYIYIRYVFINIYIYIHVYIYIWYWIWRMRRLWYQYLCMSYAMSSVSECRPILSYRSTSIQTIHWYALLPFVVPLSNSIKVARRIADMAWRHPHPIFSDMYTVCIYIYVHTYMCSICVCVCVMHWFYICWLNYKNSNLKICVFSYGQRGSFSLHSPSCPATSDGSSSCLRARQFPGKIRKLWGLKKAIKNFI